MTGWWPASVGPSVTPFHRACATAAGTWDEPAPFPLNFGDARCKELTAPAELFRTAQCPFYYKHADCFRFEASKSGSGTSPRPPLPGRLCACDFLGLRGLISLWLTPSCKLGTEPWHPFASESLDLVLHVAIILVAHSKQSCPFFPLPHALHTSAGDVTLF